MKLTDREEGNDDFYETTFSREIDYALGDRISSGFIFEMIAAISERMKIEPSNVVTAFKFESGAEIRATSGTNIKRILEDSKKYKRNIEKINIESGIIHESKGSRTHYSLSFNAQKIGSSFRGMIYAYAVAKDASDSQKVIDWGAGTLNDFQNIDSLDIKLKRGELIIQSSDGSVERWASNTGDDESIQKVEVINEIGVKSSKWKDKQNIIGIASIVGTFIIALVTWIYFSGRP